MNKKMLHVIMAAFITANIVSCAKLKHTQINKSADYPVYVKVERLLDVPIEEVFNKLSDHANYSQFPGIDESRLLKPGLDHPNGKGALRMVKSGFVRVEEEITGYDPPVMMKYLIRSSSPFTIDHKIGLVQLEQIGSQTRVVWISESDIKTPVIDSLIERKARKDMAKGIDEVLKFIEKDYQDPKNKNVK